MAAHHPRHRKRAESLLKKVIFTFYNDQLSRIVVSYDRDRTEGLTAEDLIEAVSADLRRDCDSCPRKRVRCDSSLEPAGQVRRVLGGPAILGHTVPFQLPVDVWHGVALKAA